MEAAETKPPLGMKVPSENLKSFMAFRTIEANKTENEDPIRILDITMQAYG